MGMSRGTVSMIETGDRGCFLKTTSISALYIVTVPVKKNAPGDDPVHGNYFLKLRRTIKV